MLPEIEVAVTFLTKLIAKSVDPGGSKDRGGGSCESSGTSSASSNGSTSPNTTTTHSSNNNSTTPPKNYSSSSESIDTTESKISLNQDQLQEFSRKLSNVLHARFANHWYPEKPTKGQAYRCVRINSNYHVEPSIAQVCSEMNLSYHSLRLPLELTLWIDPHEVTCRYDIVVSCERFK